jgi:heme-degrading monooxygenase HmoA
MLFNTVTLKPESRSKTSLALGHLLGQRLMEEQESATGFLAGQVFRFSGFVSEEGTLSASKTAENHYVIVTYWRSFEDHERSHSNELFSRKFAALAAMCADTKELGYDMLWQGQAEQQRT